MDLVQGVACWLLVRGAHLVGHLSEDTVAIDVDGKLHCQVAELLGLVARLGQVIDDLKKLAEVWALCHHVVVVVDGEMIQYAFELANTVHEIVLLGSWRVLVL